MIMLCVKSGRVSHSWCMCVASHGSGGLGAGRDGGVGGRHTGRSQGRLVICGEMPEHFLSVG